MKGTFYGYLFLALFGHFSLILAQSQNCYFCNSEDHGAACHDPIDPNQIQTQRCSDQLVEPVQSYYSEIVDFFKRHSIFAEDEAAARNTVPNVCFSMTYVFSARNVTARGCEQAQRNTTLGTVDVCAYYQQLIPNRITNFNCSVCPGNLCNYETRQGSGSTRIVSLNKLITGILLAKILMY